MSTERRFDAIVVGAGPAGCACGFELARAGLQVLVVERGSFAGAKNMWGGVFYGPAVVELFPDFWTEAPVERHISQYRFSLLSHDSCVTTEFSSSRLDQAPYQAFTALRSRFDRWLADKVTQAGAIVATGVQADDFVRDGNRIAGIRAGNDEIPANVVVACDGVNSLLAQKAGLRGEFSPHDVKLGIKEVILRPRQAIDRLFNVAGDQGVAWELIGSCTRGLPGGAFIYTNRESLSLGIVVQLSALIEHQVTASDLLEDFKKHPSVVNLFAGGELAEYSAHLIPVGGVRTMPDLYSDGLLVAGDAAGLVLGTGLHLEGANLAVESGVAAARTIVRATQDKDFSAASLAYYRELLEKSFVLQDLREFARAPAFLENPRIYGAYPDLACSFAEKIFTSDGKPRRRSWLLLREAMKDRVSLWQMARDLMNAKAAI